MGDDPVAWDEAKTKRAEERQRRAIAEEKRKAGKSGTQTLTIELPSKAEFAIQEKEFELGYIGTKAREEFIRIHAYRWSKRCKPYFDIQEG